MSLPSSLRQIFDLVFQAPPADRPALLDRECGGDAALRRRLEAMIAAAEGESFLGEPTADVLPRPSDLPTHRSQAAVTQAVFEGPGTRIGPYKLLQLIGEGGFGSVFMAEQERPVARKVALKIIKLGMDTRAVVARFEQERQALALMDHPNIAKVFDAGATETGRPYFAMELCKGDPITLYSDKQSLRIRDRLELFAQVCQAVQHAHAKGVIHRDLKPSNILVSSQDGRPHAKIIDFGIAKATASKLTEKTLFTEHKQLIGTPEYMSPEQAEGSLDIDTRTDVYSLGVLLYELLTGSTPFTSNELRSVAYAEIQRIIREVDPPKPSTRLSESAETIASVAASRHTEPKRLGAIVRGELDWIVMKALEKDRARRYESANSLAADIQRHLAGEAVVAAPPGASYRARKFIRRHKAAVAVAGVITLALLLGLAGTTYGLQKAIRARNDEAAAKTTAVAEAHKARDAEAQAKARAAELKQVSDFQADMLAQIDPNNAGKLLTAHVAAKLEKSLAAATPPIPESERAAQLATFKSLWSRINATDAARELIDSTILKPAIETINEQFKDQPIVDAQLRHSLANLYLELGFYAAALPLDTSALATRRRVLGDDHPDTLKTISDIGLVLQSQGKLAESEPYRREALNGYRRVRGEDHPDTVTAISSMGFLLKAQGKLADAEPYYREAMDKHRRLLGKDHPSTLKSINNMAALLQAQGKLAEAEPLYREALESRRRLLGEEHAETLTSISNMGSILQSLGKLSEAEPLYREFLEKSRRTLGEEHPSTLVAINNIGNLLQAQNKFAQAEPFIREAMEKRRRTLGPEHPSTLTSINNMGAVLKAQGRLAEAEPFFREAVEKRGRTLGQEHPSTLLSMSHLGALLQAQGKLAEAEPVLRDAMEKSRRVLGDAHPDTLNAIGNMTSLLQDQGKPAQIVDLLAPVEAAARKTFTGGNIWRLASFLVRLGTARAAIAHAPADFPPAEANLLEAHGIYLKTRGETHEDTQDCARTLADLYATWNSAEPGKGHDTSSAEWRSRAGRPRESPKDNP